VGAAAGPADERYAASLPRLADELGVADAVSFRGSLPYSAIPPAYHRGGVLLNVTPSALDKAILEGMASGCLPVSRDPGFQRIARENDLDDLVPEAGAAGLADAVAELLARPPAERDELRERTRAIVVNDHGLSGLADRIYAHLEGART
jgi:glycosyltransferase involved in cell wall biosynthesis